MTPYQDRLCPITKRLVEDMLIRRYSQATIDSYTYHVRRFADFINKKSPSTAQPLKLSFKSFQLDPIQTRKASYSSFNQAVCALRLLYSITHKMPWPVTMVPYRKRSKTLPVVLSRQEVERLIQCTENLKQRTFLLTLYGGGLRFSEGANLKLADIDSQRMQLRINQGKGGKDRIVPLSPRLLQALREYWKHYRPTIYLFPGKTPDRPYADTTIQKTMKRAALKAGIKKRVHPHVLRHSYATGLLEAGVDLLTISRLLGHASFMTTMVYLHCRREHLNSAPSPLDWLPVRQLPTYRAPEEGPNTNVQPTQEEPPTPTEPMPGATRPKARRPLQRKKRRKPE